MKIKNILFLYTFLFSLFASAQETYTLEKCITTAIENNLDLKNTKLKAEASKVNLQQAWGAVMPSINGNYNIGVNNGRSIDPYTNSYINQKLTFSNFGLSLNAPIFNGFRLKNRIKQNRFNLKASEMEVESARQTLTIKVTLAYLNVLNAEDALELSKDVMEVTEKQEKRLAILNKEGKGNPADYTDMQGQLNSDKINVISAKNNLRQTKIALFKLLSLDTNFQATFKNIDTITAFIPYPYPVDEIYKEALKNQATFKAKEFRRDAAQSSISVAKADFTPEISFFGQLNTNYSSTAKLFNETGSTVVSSDNFVKINGQKFPVYTHQTQYDETDIGYKDQFDNNLSTSYGLSVNIPLFNGFKAKQNVKLKKIELKESEVNLKNTKRQYKQSIEISFSDMQSAYDRYLTLQKQVESYKESFRINEVRFNNGVSNIIEYITSKNNLDTAKLNLSISKYDYLLRTKILDYYRGI